VTSNLFLENYYQFPSENGYSINQPRIHMTSGQFQNFPQIPQNYFGGSNSNNYGYNPNENYSPFTESQSFSTSKPNKLIPQTNSNHQNEKILTSKPPQVDRASKNFQCGTRETSKMRFTSLVVNGLKAERTDFPWLVAHYSQKNSFICGGSLISNNLVVTAAHCVWNKGNAQPISADDSTYYVGKHKLYDLKESGYISSDVQQFIVHKNWNFSLEASYDSDIAIAVLVKKIIFSNTIRPICIWEESLGHSDLVDKKGLVAGKIKIKLTFLLTFNLFKKFRLGVYRKEFNCGSSNVYKCSSC
jgi:hypothetical protein